MSDNEFKYSQADEIAKRTEAYHLFLERMFDEDDRPYFVSDEACLYDIFSGEDEEFISRCLENYGHKMEPAEFLLPVWKLLDILGPCVKGRCDK